MEVIGRIISQSFYTQLLMILSALIAVIIGTVFRKKNQTSRVLVLYPAASLIQSFLAYYAFFTRQDRTIESISTNLFILVEFLIIYHFFHLIIVLPNLKKFIRLTFALFIAYIFLMWSFTNTFLKYPIKIFLFESLCILFFCFIFFIQLFRLPPKLDLVNDSSFWITIGCLFYFSCTTPLFFIDSTFKVLPQYHNFYSINFLAYAILFLFISKAFLCRPAQTR
jgi:hypothetical protein